MIWNRNEFGEQMIANFAQTKGSVMILAYYYPPMNVSGALRPFRFAKYLPCLGYRIYLVASETDTQVSENVYHTGNCQTGDRLVSLHTGIARAVQRLLPYNEQLPWVPAAVAIARKLLAVHPISAIFSTSPPVATHLAALYLKRRFGIPWVADFRDPLRDNPFRTRPWAARYDAALERWIFRNADAIIANTDTVAELWRQRYPQWVDKIATIWNGYDPEEIIEPLPVPARPYRVIAHVGSLYGGRQPKALLSSLVRLLRAGALNAEQLRVQLIGPMEPQIVRMMENEFSFLLQRGCLEYHAHAIPQAEANLRMAEADYLLLLDINERNAGLQVPAKIFDYIRLGKPILAFTAKRSPVERILCNSGIPYIGIYSDDSPFEMDRKITSFFMKPVTAAVASSFFHETFDASRQAGTLAAILDRIRGEWSDPQETCREVRLNGPLPDEAGERERHRPLAKSFRSK